jgi:multiple sugar transport system permease protein
MSTAYRGAARWALSAPLLVFMLLVVLFPLTYGFYTSVRERTLFSLEQRFVGLDNYQAVISDPSFWDAMLFTVVFTVVTVAFELVLGVGLALLFNQRFPGKKVLLTFILLPIMVASALIAVMWRLGLNPNIGLVPDLLQLLNIELAPLSSTWVVPTLFTAEILHWTPLVFILCYAGLQAVPGELYEASRMDGAGYWRMHWHIILPQLRPVIAVALFLRAIDAVKSFDLIYVLTGGGPGRTTTNASIYIYQTAFVDGDFGVASAASVVMLLLMLVLVPLVVRQVVSREG